MSGKPLSISINKSFQLKSKHNICLVQLEFGATIIIDKGRGLEPSTIVTTDNLNNLSNNAKDYIFYNVSDEDWSFGIKGCLQGIYTWGIETEPAVVITLLGETDSSS